MDEWIDDRRRMVVEQIEARGVRSPRVIQAMLEVPRHLFVPPEYRIEAYGDHPLAIGRGQTISQPYVVAAMTEALGLAGHEKVLEIGTGSGYQTAILAKLAREVHTMERIPGLQASAMEILRGLGLHDVVPVVGDGFSGLPEAAPFDAIVVTAAPPEVPGPLVDQLAPGGTMVIPVGRYSQTLMKVTKHGDGLTTERPMFPVRFVPMVHGTERE